MSNRVDYCVCVYVGRGICECSLFGMADETSDRPNQNQVKSRNTIIVDSIGSEVPFPCMAHKIFITDIISQSHRI